MGNIRKPQQKRSHDTKMKILEHGFQLFCQKGYYGTTTTEIAKAAKISTGALYSYYPDKKKIFIEAFENFLNEQFSLLYLKIEASSAEHFDLSAFVEIWMDFFLTLYQNSGKALAHLTYIMAEDEEISQHFCHYEDGFIKRIHSILVKYKLPVTHLPEKIFMSYILTDSFGQIDSSFSYSSIDTSVLRQLLTHVILENLTKE